MTAGCTLLILAGGRSRRMGRDKAALPVGDGTLVAYLARRLAPVVDEILVAGGPDTPVVEGVGMVQDRFAGRGPLAGMHAGLLQARQPLVWVVGCDLPDVELRLGPLMTSLATNVDAVVPRPGQEPEGVCAVYRRELASRIETLLQAGDYSVKSLLAASDVRYLTAMELREIDPQLRSFRNLNTPADYEAWIRTH